MERLRARGLDQVIIEQTERGKPLLGLCLGMQLLFDHSEEGAAQGLALVPGVVRLLPAEEKVPHIGWNQVTATGESDLWRDLSLQRYFYFVHSYVCEPEEQRVVAGTTGYGLTFCSAIQDGHIWGVQFHPERSGRDGLRLIKNFAEFCAR
jgi:glutamine amidotransferase